VEQLEWVGRWMDELVNMPRRGNELKVLLYVTRTSVGESGNGVVFKGDGC
jgi:predicted KAP-like P-loop ATPase